MKVTKTKIVKVNPQISNCVLCNSEINYKGTCEACYIERKMKMNKLRIMIHLIDVTEENDSYTIARRWTKTEALVYARELVNDQGLKIDVYDPLNRFKTIEIR